MHPFVVKSTYGVSNIFFIKPAKVYVVLVVFIAPICAPHTVEDPVILMHQWNHTVYAVSAILLVYPSHKCGHVGMSGLQIAVRVAFCRYMTIISFFYKKHGRKPCSLVYEVCKLPLKFVKLFFCDFLIFED